MWTGIQFPAHARVIFCQLQEKKVRFLNFEILLKAVHRQNNFKLDQCPNLLHLEYNLLNLGQNLFDLYTI